MDISLQRYLEGHSKEEFTLRLKVFVLRQVTQALAYLHFQDPPLIHHGLNPNKVMLNVVSYVTKVNMSLECESVNPLGSLPNPTEVCEEIGSVAFTAPEALQVPRRYNEKIDVFSFGNIILYILTHVWPEPDPRTKHDGDRIVSLTEYRRRERYTVQFTAQEERLFIPRIWQCLENQPDKRPASEEMVQYMRCIESSLPESGHVATPMEQLRQQLLAKEEECKQKDKVIMEKDTALKRMDTTMKEQQDTKLREKDTVLVQKAKLLRETEEACRQKDEALRVAEEACRQKDEALRETKEACRQKNEALTLQTTSLREKEEACRQKDEVIGRLLRSGQSTEQHQHIAKAKDGPMVSQLKATPFSVSTFLKKHEDDFFNYVNPRQSLLRLKRKGVITEDVKYSIDAANTKDAREILYDHMISHGNLSSLTEYCEMAVDADGLPNMKALGQKMLEELPT